MPQWIILQIVDALHIIIGKTMNKALKTLNIAFTKQASSQDPESEYYTFSGLASTFGNLDQGNDIVIKGAFTNSLKQRMPKLLWQHDVREVIGTIDSAEENEDGLLITARLPKKVKRAREAGILLEMGALDSMSIGFNIADMDYTGDIRLLKALDLYEISLVTMPMNEKAIVESIKSVVGYQDYTLAEEEVVWDRSAAEKRIRAHFDAEEAPNAQYAKNFMWIDQDKKDSFEGYKLLITDVIDGKVKAVPRAIYAVVGVLNSARGGLDIPGTDKDKVKKNVEKYYAKMDKDSPFKTKFFTIDDVKEIMSIRDVENTLRDTGCFSREAAMYLISCIKKQQLPRESEDCAMIESFIAELKDFNKALI